VILTALTTHLKLTIKAAFFAAEKEINNTGTYEIPVQPNFNNNTVGNTDNIKVNTKILLRLFGFLCVVNAAFIDIYLFIFL